MTHAPDGNGRLRNLIQVVGIAVTMAAIMVPAWITVRVQLARIETEGSIYRMNQSAEIAQLRRSLDSVTADARRFQVNVDRVLRDLNARVPARRPPN